MAKCTECGAGVAEDTKFCGYCGAKLNVIGEHLGAQILGNTQVIMAALERIYPGAARQYTVLGSVTAGPMAGGLLLNQPREGGDATLWSNGDELTEIALELVWNVWQEGAFHWNPELVHRCGTCLETCHYSRRSFFWEKAPSRYWQLFDQVWTESINAWPAFVQFSQKRWVCPMCAARQLRSLDLLSTERESGKAWRAAVEHALDWRRKDAEGIRHRFRKKEWDRQELARLESASQTLEAILSESDRLAERVRSEMDSVESLRKSVFDTVVGQALEPIDSMDAWWAYQLAFVYSNWCLRVEFRDRQNPFQQWIIPVSASNDESFSRLNDWLNEFQHSKESHLILTGSWYDFAAAK